MPALSAAFGSFHVKSWSTSLVELLTTVRVLPFFLTVTFLRSTTVLVSTFTVRSYTAHRYSLMQISATKHSSTISMVGTVARVSFCSGSGVFNVATCTGGSSGGGSGDAPGKATSAITASAP